MTEPYNRQTHYEPPPADRREIVVVCNRVVELETRHVGEAMWIATGRVSQPLPAGPRLQSPIEVTASGSTESAAVEALCSRIREIR